MDTGSEPPDGAMKVPRDVLRAARDEFAALWARDAPEREWQSFLAAHPYVLCELLPRLKFVASDLRALGRPGRSEPDFAFHRSRSGQPAVYGVIELKRPRTQILRIPRKEILTLSADATTAAAQAREYGKILQRQIVAHESEMIACGGELHLFLIMGLSAELVRKVTTNVLQEQLDELLPANMSLVPFDTLYDLLASKVPPKVHMLAPSAPFVASQAAVIVDYAHEGRVTRRSDFVPRPLRGIRSAGDVDRVSTIGGCPTCDAVDGASTLAPWDSTPIARMQRFYSGTTEDYGYRILACTNTELDEPFEFCEIYDLNRAKEWFESLRSGRCGRCESQHIKQQNWGSPPAYEFTTWTCLNCGFEEEKHEWGSMSSGA